MKVCLVGDMSSTFVHRDYDILSGHFDVDVVEPPRTGMGWLRYPGRVKRKVRQADVVFGWFAGWHTAPAVYYVRSQNVDC